MASQTVYDVVVVGAGVEGSSTAYNLSKRGCKVLLIEQFPLPHSRGSSHGQTRITRKAYPEPYYAHMMNYCTEEWKRLQELAGETLYKQIGYLGIGESKGKFLKDTESSMKRTGAPYMMLTELTLSLTYPMLRYGSEYGAIWDPDGGILMADKALRAMQKFFVQNGGTLADGEKIIEVSPGDTIQLKTSKRDYRSKAVVFACGPWTNSVLRLVNLSLPLKPMRISVCYWPEKVPGSHAVSKLPTFYEPHCCAGYSVYGLPSEEYPGHVKICLHGGPEIDPESRDTPDSQWTVDALKEYVSKHFPGLRPSPSIVETCIYTNTPDEDFILDHHPKWKNVVIGAGFSGHGFKLAPAVGHILADLALGEPPKFDLNPFKISRFHDASKAKL